LVFIFLSATIKTQAMTSQQIQPSYWHLQRDRWFFIIWVFPPVFQPPIFTNHVEVSSIFTFPFHRASLVFHLIILSSFFGHPFSFLLQQFCLYSLFAKTLSHTSYLWNEQLSAHLSCDGLGFLNSYLINLFNLGQLLNFLICIN
jgi:hypothetical protein